MNNISEIDSDLQKKGKEKLTEHLEKRHRDRQHQLDTKHERNKQNSAEDEDQEFFQNNFRAQVKSIEKDLDNLKPGDRSQLTLDINHIMTAIQNLQNYFTSATLFLSNYNVKACQSTINDLKNKTDAAKEKLLAKKKFGFRSKADATSTAPVLKTETDSVAKTQQITPDNIDHINWTVQNRNNEEIILESGAVNDQDITISSIKNCLIQIIGHPGSVQVSHLINCVILCGPVSRSFFADNCTNCKFAFGCQQLRLHTSNYCDLYMHVTCRAIIEDCKNINVAPYNHSYANVDDDFAKAGLNLEKNHWNDVADFNWLSTDVPSPHWQTIPIDKRITCWNSYLIEFRQKILSN